MIDSAHLESLIIFPLPDVVFFPGTLLPLHIFEPRYRQMTRDALEQERPIAMATIDPSGRTDSYDRPLVRPYAGVGKIVESEELADGRFLMVLGGEMRVRIVDEYAPERPYRLVRAVPVPDEPGDEQATEDALESIRALVMTMRGANARLASVVMEELEKHPDPAVFTNRLASMIGGDTNAQYRFLQTIRVSDRMTAIVEKISDILARISATSAGGGTSRN